MRPICVATAIVISLALAAPAQGAVFTPQGCFSDPKTGDDCVKRAEGLTSPWSAAVSPDGRSVYVASEGDEALVVFRRDTGNGTLTAVGCIADLTATPVGDDGSWTYSTSTDCGVGRAAEGLSKVQDVVVSPDGHYVYAAGEEVAAFVRDTATGDLSPIQCLTSLSVSPGCNYRDSLPGGHDVAVSPDGRDLYVRASDLQHYTIDSASGRVTYQGAVHMPGPGGGYGDTVVSPDGRSVYVGSQGRPGALAILDRDPATGSTEPRTCIVDRDYPGGCPISADGLEGLRDIAISPDGRSVYAVGTSDNAVAVFSRTPPESDLVPQGCVELDLASYAVFPRGPECQGRAPGLFSVGSVEVAPAGDEVYTASLTGSSVTRFDRGADGALTPRGCVSDVDPSIVSRKKGLYIFETSCGLKNTGQGLEGIGETTASPDGKSLYTVSSGTDHSDNAITPLSLTGARQFPSAQLQVKVDRQQPLDSRLQLKAACRKPCTLYASADFEYKKQIGPHHTRTETVFLRDYETKPKRRWAQLSFRIPPGARRQAEVALRAGLKVGTNLLVRGANGAGVVDPAKVRIDLR